jgi:hypothetical protein
MPVEHLEAIRAFNEKRQMKNKATISEIMALLMDKSIKYSISTICKSRNTLKLLDENEDPSQVRQQ